MSIKRHNFLSPGKSTHMHVPCRRIGNALSVRPLPCHNTKRLTVNNRGCRVWIVPRSFHVKYNFSRCRKYYFEHVSFLFLLLCIHVYVLYILSINTILPLREYKIIIITSPFIVKSTKENDRDISLLGFTVLTGLV
jgi:hypothetical protein